MSRDYKALREFLEAEGLDTATAPEPQQQESAAAGDNADDLDLDTDEEDEEDDTDTDDEDDEDEDLDLAGAAAFLDEQQEGYEARDVLCAGIGLFAQESDDGDAIIADRIRWVQRELLSVAARRRITRVDIVERLREAFRPQTRSVVLHAIAHARIRAAFGALVPAEAWQGAAMRFWPADPDQTMETLATAARITSRR